jgi:hypothetical protein
VMRQIQTLGFRIMSAPDTAAMILSKVRRGKKQFALPFYASFFVWLAPRFPFVIDRIHARVLDSFRQPS